VAETGTGRTHEEPGAFGYVFGEDRYSYEDYVVIVGHGRDRATATRRVTRIRRELPRAVLASGVAWGRRDGNVVYEVFGPTRAVGVAKVLPHDITPQDVRRFSEGSSRGMRKALAHCLDGARLD
jgi:hypothetical protein